MFEEFAYLAVLLATIGCLTLIDWRYGLAWFHDRRRTARTIVLAMAVFVIWDLLGVGLHIFMIGEARWLTGLRLGPEFPVEELFFLYVLVYTTLVCWRAGEKLWPHT